MQNDYDDPETGMLLLASHSGARANTQEIMNIIGAGGVVENAIGELVPVRHGYVEGVTPNELYALAHQGLINLAKSHHLNDVGLRFSESNHPPVHLVYYPAPCDLLIPALSSPLPPPVNPIL